MARNTITAVFPLLLILLSIASSTFGFTANPSQKNHRLTPPSARYATASTTEGGGDPSEVIARKIVVCGDVDGGYYRSCVKNEVCLLSSYHVFICFISLKIEVDIILTTRFSFKSRNIIQGSRFRKLSGTMSPPDDSKKAEILVEVSIVYTCCVVSVESGDV